MNLSELLAVFDDTAVKCRALLISSNADYAADHDALANFSNSAGFLTQAGLPTTKFQSLAIAFHKHLSSVFKHCANPDFVGRESMDGRVHDSINYLVLLFALYLEHHARPLPVQEDGGALAEEPVAATPEPSTHSLPPAAARALGLPANDGRPPDQIGEHELLGDV